MNPNTNIIILILISSIGIIVSYLGSFLFEEEYLPRLFNEHIKNPFHKRNRLFKMLLPYIVFWIFIGVIYIFYS